MYHRLSCLLAGAIALLVALALVPAAGATPVSVRVVGDAVGLDTTQVNTTGTPVPGGCAGHSAGEALDLAVAGNWDRMAFASTILGETRDYMIDSTYWNFWINDTYSAKGLCDYTVSPGDRILMLVQHDTPDFKPTVFPLTLSTPATVVAGTPFTVTVDEQRTDGGATTPAPSAGATVAGGGASTQTDAAGRATLALATPGTVRLRASHPGNVASDAIAVTVAPAGTTLPSAVADRSAPVASILGIAEGRRFARGAGPRTLRIRVAPDPSGLLAVKLRLTRIDRGRCTYFSGKSERFRLNDRGRCGAPHGYWFAVGDRASVDYLLPFRLPRGRYILDVKAIDRANNRDDARRRGTNRVVFRVG